MLTAICQLQWCGRSVVFVSTSFGSFLIQLCRNYGNYEYRIAKTLNFLKEKKDFEDMKIEMLTQAIYNVNNKFAKVHEIINNTEDGLS